MGTTELYSPSDPYQRQPRSPRKQRQPSGGELHSVAQHQPWLTSFNLEMNALYIQYNEQLADSGSGCWAAGWGGRTDTWQRPRLHTMSTAPCSSSCPSTGGITDSSSICSVGQSRDSGACVFMICAVRGTTAIKQHIILNICLLFLTCLLFLSLSYHPVVLCFSSFFSVSVVWCWIQDY